jgi:chemotaxis protein CheX
MTRKPSPTSEDLLDIAEQVWSAYLDPEGVNPLIPVPPAPRRPVDDVSAVVRVSGAWSGHVVIGFSSVGSRWAAAALLGIDVDEISPADVTDAVGELANVIGGNVKSLLPEPSALSLPYVLTADNGTVGGLSAIQVCKLFGEWLNEPVTVSVLASDTGSVGATA